MEGSCTLQLHISPCKTWCSQPHRTCLASSFRNGRLPGLKCSPFGWCWDLELNTDVSNTHSFSCNYCCRRIYSGLEHTHPALNCYLSKPHKLKQASKNCVSYPHCIQLTAQQYWGCDMTSSLFTAVLVDQGDFCGDRSSSEQLFVVHLVTWNGYVQNKSYLAGVLRTGESLWDVKLFPCWNERAFAFRFLKPHSFSRE